MVELAENAWTSGRVLWAAGPEVMLAAICRLRTSGGAGRLPGQ